MTILFYIIFAISILVFLLRRRALDFFTFLFVVTVYYCIPLFTGILYDPNSHEIISISPLAYFFYAIYFLTLLGFALLTDFSSHLVIPSRHTKFYYRSYANILFYLSSFFFIVVLMQNPKFMIPSDLDNDLTSLGFSYTLFVFSSILLLLFSCLSDSRLLTTISSFYILTTLSAGSRAYFSHALVCVFFYIGSKSKSFSFIEKPRFLIVGLFSFIFLFFFKIAYPFLLALDFPSLFKALTNFEEISQRSFQWSENFAVMLNLNYSLVNLSPDINFQYFPTFIVSSLPLISDFVGDTFGLDVYSYSSILKTSVYQNVSYGMASSHYGQLFYLLGQTAFVAPFLFFSLVFVLNKLTMSLRRDYLFLVPFLSATVVSYLRVEFSGLLYFFSAYIFLYLLVRLFHHVFLESNL